MGGALLEGAKGKNTKHVFVLVCNLNTPVQQRNAYLCSGRLLFD